MRTKIPLAPREPDVTVCIVLNDFGPLGSAYVETDEAKADEATIVENILSGQYSYPVRVSTSPSQCFRCMALMPLAKWSSAVS